MTCTCRGNRRESGREDDRRISIFEHGWQGRNGGGDDGVSIWSFLLEIDKRRSRKVLACVC